MLRIDSFANPYTTVERSNGFERPVENEARSDRFFSGFGNPILPGDTLMTED